MIIRENYGEEHEYSGLRNHGFLFNGMSVSKTPDTGVTEPGILTRHNHLDFCTYEFEEYIGLLPLISSNP